MLIADDFLIRETKISDMIFRSSLLEKPIERVKYIMDKPIAKHTIEKKLLIKIDFCSSKPMVQVADDINRGENRPL